VGNLKDNSPGTNTLEQNFNQLPPEGKIHLKEYLQSLVAIQNTMTGADFTDNANTSPKEDKNNHQGRCSDKKP